MVNFTYLLPAFTSLILNVVYPCNPTPQALPQVSKAFESLVAQDQARQIVYDVIRDRHEDDGIRPLVLFFAGGPGLGKTYMSQLLATSFFTGPFAFKRTWDHCAAASGNLPLPLKDLCGYTTFDCGQEFVDTHRDHEYYKNKIFGRLAKVLKRTNYPIVVFDDYEKAAPGTLSCLKQILQSGDSSLFEYDGQVYDASKAILIFITNQPGDVIRKAVALDPDLRKNGAAYSDLGNEIKRELLLNPDSHWQAAYGGALEIDSVVSFLPYRPSDLLALFKHRIEHLRQCHAASGRWRDISVSNKALQAIIRSCVMFNVYNAGASKLTYTETGATSLRPALMYLRRCIFKFAPKPSKKRARPRHESQDKQMLRIVIDGEDLILQSCARESWSLCEQRSLVKTLWQGDDIRNCS